MRVRRGVLVRRRRGEQVDAPCQGDGSEFIADEPRAPVGLVGVATLSIGPFDQGELGCAEIRHSRISAE